MFGQKEAVALTNIDAPNATTVNEARLQLALDDAECEIKNYIDAAPLAAKVLISSSFRRVSAILARYYLDTINPREHVKHEWETILKNWDLAAERARSAGIAGARNLIRAGGQKAVFVQTDCERWAQVTYDYSRDTTHALPEYEQLSPECPIVPQPDEII